MRKILALILVVVFLSISTFAMAWDGLERKNITAIYQDLKIIVNDRLLSTPKQTFLLENGQLMIPLRFLAEELGYNVEWDPLVKTIYIEDNPNFFNRNDSVPLENLPVLRNVGPFYNLQSRQITIAGRKFKHGLIIKIGEENSAQDNQLEYKTTGEVVLDLQGDYQWLEGYVGVDDETRNSYGSFQLIILGDDLPLYESSPIKPAEYPFKVHLNIEKVKRLTIKVLWLKGETGDDDQLWAALANWMVY